MREFAHMIQAFQFRDEFWCLILPLALMAVDVLTGFMDAWAKKEIQSSKLRIGLSKKVGELAVLIVGELFSFALKLPPEVMKFLAFYIILMEIISIVENLNKLGVPVPKGIKKVLNDTSDKIQNSDSEEVKQTTEEVTDQNDDSGNNRESN